MSKNTMQTNEAAYHAKKKSQWADVLVRLKRNKLAMAGLVLLILILLSAVFANQLAPNGYDQQDLSIKFLAPSAQHPCGTDNLGRDILGRLVYGGRVSLLVGLCATTFSAIVGVILGTAAGFWGNKVDNIIMRLMDILLAMPQMLLAIAIAATLGPGVKNSVLAVGIANIPRFARIVRAPILTQRGLEYVEAATAINASNTRIMFRHLLPNVLAPIIVEFTLGVGIAIISTASLSFLGLGVQAPTPEWGSMLSSGRQYMRGHWWISTFPGIAIMLTIFSLNVLGDGLRDALDPRLKN